MQLKSILSLHLAFVCFVFLSINTHVDAAVLATGFYTNQIYRFDTATGAQTVFNGGIPEGGLSAIAVNHATGRVYVAAYQTGNIYSFDGYTPNSAVTSFAISGGTNPSGIAINQSTGQLYITYADGMGAGQVGIYSATGSLQSTITTPGIGLGGLALRDSNTLLIGNGLASGVSANISQLDLTTNTLTNFSNPAFVASIANQIAIDATGNVYAGTLGIPNFTPDGNNVYKFDAAGVASLFASVTSPGTIPIPILPFMAVPSSPYTSPSAVVIDSNGDIIVGVSGQTRPDEGDSNGAILRYSPSGVLLNTVVNKFTPINALALQPTAVPEPATLALISLIGVGWGYRKIRKTSKVRV